jgi:hypothetical protein
LGKDEEEIKNYQHLIERPIKLRVAKLLKVLIDTYYTEFSPQLKELLSIFIGGIADPEYSATLRKSMEKGVRKLRLNPTTTKNQKLELFSKFIIFNIVTSTTLESALSSKTFLISKYVLFKSIESFGFVVLCFIRLN